MNLKTIAGNIDLIVRSEVLKRDLHESLLNYLNALFNLDEGSSLFVSNSYYPGLKPIVYMTIQNLEQCSEILKSLAPVSQEHLVHTHKFTSEYLVKFSPLSDFTKTSFVSIELLTEEDTVFSIRINSDIRVKHDLNIFFNEKDYSEEKANPTKQHFSGGYWTLVDTERIESFITYIKTQAYKE